MFLDAAAVKYETPEHRKAADRKIPATITAKLENASKPLIPTITGQMPSIR